MWLLEIATICGGVFAGAAIYISAVEHPARMERGTQFALTQFAPSYRRAAVMQASLALLGFLAAVVAWSRSQDIGVLAGALLLGSAIPFTLLVIRPTNKRLLDPRLDPTSEEAASLLRRWGALHSFRSMASAAAFALFLARLRG